MLLTCKLGGGAVLGVICVECGYDNSTSRGKLRDRELGRV